jgi:hypothetical protein
MDAHYDQVMKAREQSGSGVRRYFAYSTVLDRAAFEEWRGQHGYDFFSLPEGDVAEALDVGLVYDFPSRWWGGRVAGLQDQPGSRIFGKLFEIAEKDWPIIQHKEGFVTHMCGERTVRVKVGDQLLEATAFTTRPERMSSDGPVSARFVQALVRGARSAGLPEDYVASLATVAD